jgi:hypothetical protein
LIASINSGLSVKASFHAIISKLTELSDSELPLPVVIQLESGFVVSTA